MTNSWQILKERKTQPVITVLNFIDRVRISMKSARVPTSDFGICPYFPDCGFISRGTARRELDWRANIIPFDRHCESHNSGCA